MSVWNDDIQQNLVGELTRVSLEERAAILAGPGSNDNHREHFDRLEVLRQVEAVGAPRRQSIDGPARVVAWNVERLRHIDAITETLKHQNADVALLCEVDRGMARTQNTDRIADLATRLAQPYLYAVEFLELGLGDLNEQEWHKGENNALGFHGAALVSDVAMQKPFLIRLDDRGSWFDGVLHERRVGGTIALGAKVMVMGKPVTMVSAHLESNCDPATRGHDMRGMLEKIERIAPGEAVVLGGDFNSSTGGIDDWRDRDAWRAKMLDEPTRLTSPEPYEPQFAAAKEFGYDWHACNVMGVATQRFVPGRARTHHKLDWFFTRGLVATDPAIIPAVQADGSPSSDHECLAVTVTPT